MFLKLIYRQAPGDSEFLDNKQLEYFKCIHRKSYNQESCKNSRRKRLKYSKKKKRQENDFQCQKMNNTVENEDAYERVCIFQK